MDPKRKEKIQRAATLAGKDFSSFVAEAAEREADRILEERAATWLPTREFDRLMKLLDEPDKPLAWAAQVRMKKRYRR